MVEETAGSVLRRARKESRLSQTEMARRAGVAQSVISAYEAGRREPGVATLASLLEATGHRLVLELETIPGAPRGLPNTTMGSRLRRRRRQVLAVADRFGARNVRVFGSVARGDDGPHSDIDFLVDLDAGVGLIKLAGLERELSTLLGRPVDVVPADGLKPRVRAAVERDVVQL